eukprot:CAMPEP_0179355788 /NCGR_PEP_ID=MMETSP0797-20121207/77553_1 /TAXON_ID=47934 /ORGANISM="Dinophysis acuminata, Strain DAEP01" /LENGTH=52 /DNA_ID=CAMNT_0021070945 /DNA_START=35 /DNA_END=190 /DNA_ORIENTATION=+
MEPAAMSLLHASCRGPWVAVGPDRAAAGTAAVTRRAGTSGASCGAASALPPL